jgi:hypothetical protein
MKKPIVYLCAIFALLTSCSEEQPQVKQKEQVQFELGIPAAENSDGRTAGEIPAGAKASITISTPEGIINQTLDILVFGESYMTNPIELPVGAQKLTDFLILSADNEVIYAAPKEGSPLASAVNNALPQSFNVHKGKIKNVAVQVLEVGDTAPEFFGYASFGIEVVKPLAISVFIEQEGELVLTNASGLIHSGDPSQPTQQFSLAGKVNYISFKGDENESLTLVISKEGYFSKSVNFIYADLAGGAISIVLEKKPVLKLTSPVAQGRFRLDLLLSRVGSVVVDYGDGSTETVNFGMNQTSAGSYRVIHEYALPEGSARPVVSISGDLHLMYGLRLLDFTGPIDLTPVKNQFTALALRNSFFTTLDVSILPNLGGIQFEGGEIQNLIIGPENVHLKTFSFTDVNPRALPELVTEIHSHATTKNLRDGNISVWECEFSPESLALLKDLQQRLGWSVVFY